MASKLKIVEINPAIRTNVEASNGYCPCAIEQNEDTKCMCKEFRDQDTPGPCTCGRFEKVKEPADEYECICCGAAVPLGNLYCPNCLVTMIRR